MKKVYVAIFTLFITIYLCAQTDFEQRFISADIAGPAGIYTGDLDNDGDLDFAVAASDGGEVSWWRNDGGDPLTFSKQIISQSIPGAIYVYIEDVDGDGYNDVLCAAWNTGSVVWYQNDAENQEEWTEHGIDEEFPLAHEVYACDLDLDEDMDILAASADADEVAWWENMGQNTLVWDKHSIDSDFDGARSIVAGDLDGDGDLDLAGAALLSHEITCWINDGFNQLNWIRYDLSQNFLSSHKVVIINMDGDEDLDVLGTAYTSNEISWWCNDGNDPDTWSRNIVDGNFNGAVIGYAADFDMDGDTDVVGSAQGSSQVAWWENLGENTLIWDENQLTSTFLGVWPLHYGDLDSDGDIDILAGGNAANELRWYENRLYGVDFSAVPQTGHYPLEVSFTDLSNFEDTIINWEWDFDNDGDIDSSEADPVWIYGEQGIYTVALTIETADFTKTVVKEDYIKVFDGDSGLEYNNDLSYSFCSVTGMNIQDDFTIETWVSAEQTGEHYHTILDKNRIQLFINESFPIYHDNSYIIQITHSDQSISRAMTPENTVIYGNWQHLAVTYDGIGEVDFFLNGTEQEVEYVGVCSGPVADNLSDGIYIGNNSGFTRNFEGIVDEIRIWDHCRSGYDIMMHMLTYLSGNETGLLAYWRFNEAWGSTFSDQTGQIEDGEVHDAEWVQGLLLTPVANDHGQMPCPDPGLMNYPNPFKPASIGAGRSSVTAISYQLSEVGRVSLEIYNIRGQLVRTLVNGIKSAGEHEEIWDGRDQSSHELTAGIYLYKLCVDGISTTKKMMMLK